MAGVPPLGAGEALFAPPGSADALIAGDFVLMAGDMDMDLGTGDGVDFFCAMVGGTGGRMGDSLGGGVGMTGGLMTVSRGGGGWAGCGDRDSALTALAAGRLGES